MYCISVHSACTDAGRQTVAEAQASTHTPTFTLLFLSKQPEAQRMSMSVVWADILSHKESGWRHMPLQQPLCVSAYTPAPPRVSLLHLRGAQIDIFWIPQTIFFSSVNFDITGEEKKTGWRYKIPSKPCRSRLHLLEPILITEKRK